MSSLIVLKSQSQESFGGGWRTSEWGKGKRKTSRRRKNKRRNPRQEKGTRGPQRPRNVRWGDHDPGSKEANRAGPHFAARRTMDRARRGRGPHPSRGRRKKRARGRCLALSRFGDRSTLQPCCPSALGPDTGGERITPSVPIFRPQRPRGGTSESRPLLGRSSCYPSSPPDGGMHRTRGEFPCQAEWIHLSPATSIGPHRTWAQTWDPHLDPAQREGRIQVCVVCSVGPARDRDWGRSILRRDAP